MVLLLKYCLSGMQHRPLEQFSCLTLHVRVSDSTKMTDWAPCTHKVVVLR